VRRLSVLIFAAAAALTACTSPDVPLLTSEPAAATVDGHSITMAQYQARLRVSRARDPFAGIPEAMPSAAPSQRLEDFTIEQLVREEIIRQQAAQRKISVSDQALDQRLKTLEQGSIEFKATLNRNGFTAQSFRDYERALLTEIALLQSMGAQRAQQAADALKSGESFESVFNKFNDDTGTAAHHGEVGWLLTSDLPERDLASTVASLPPGSISEVVRTNRGFVIARVSERRADLIHLFVILVLAPSVDLFSPQGTPAWFTKLIDDTESELRRDGKITVRVGSRPQT
jgi:parvulin-like peptidyl-prolyl isomerase